MSKDRAARMCLGCPFDLGKPETEMAANLGCLPSIYEIKEHLGSAHSWPCHDDASKQCAGMGTVKELRPNRGLPLKVMFGVHTEATPNE